MGWTAVRGAGTAVCTDRVKGYVSGPQRRQPPPESSDATWGQRDDASLSDLAACHLFGAACHLFGAGHGNPRQNPGGFNGPYNGTDPSLRAAVRGLALPPVKLHARRLWKGRSIVSRATESGPAFRECFVCTNRYTAKCRPSKPPAAQNALAQTWVGCENGRRGGGNAPWKGGGKDFGSGSGHGCMSRTGVNDALRCAERADRAFPLVDLWETAAHQGQAGLLARKQCLPCCTNVLQTCRGRGPRERACSWTFATSNGHIATDVKTPTLQRTHCHRYEYPHAAKPPPRPPSG